jgi:hypothetical protein
LNIHLPYSQDLAPDDFHLYGPLKNYLGGKRFADDEEAETELQKWLRQQSEDFCAVGFDTLIKQWDKCFNFGGGYARNKCFRV